LSCLPATELQDTELAVISQRAYPGPFTAAGPPRRGSLGPMGADRSMEAVLPKPDTYLGPTAPGDAAGRKSPNCRRFDRFGIRRFDLRVRPRRHADRWSKIATFNVCEHGECK
jgi:hypothetical protein